MAAAAEAEGSLASALIKRDDVDFTSLGLGGGRGGRNQGGECACMSGHFKIDIEQQTQRIRLSRRAEASSSETLAGEMHNVLLSAV